MSGIEISKELISATLGLYKYSSVSVKLESKIHDISLQRRGSCKGAACYQHFS